MVVVMAGAVKFRKNALKRDRMPQDQLEILAHDWIESAVAEFRSVRTERQNPVWNIEIPTGLASLPNPESRP
jgi:hypothetical protein